MTAFTSPNILYMLNTVEVWLWLIHRLIFHKRPKEIHWFLVHYGSIYLCTAYMPIIVTPLESTLLRITHVTVTSNTSVSSSPIDIVLNTTDVSEIHLTARGCILLHYHVGLRTQKAAWSFNLVILQEFLASSTKPELFLIDGLQITLVAILVHRSRTQITNINKVGSIRGTFFTGRAKYKLSLYFILHSHNRPMLPHHTSSYLSQSRFW